MSSKKEKKALHSEEELQIRIEELRLQYKLAKMGLVMGGIFIFLMIPAYLLKTGVNLIAVLKGKEPLLSGDHMVIMIAILALAAIVFFAFVFHRLITIKGEISKAKKKIEVDVAGEAK